MFIKLFKRLFKKKDLRQICKNCKLFDPTDNSCAITVIRSGEYYQLNTSPEDECHWEKAGLIEKVNEVRSWSDGEKGYIEAPELYMGD